VQIPRLPIRSLSEAEVEGEPLSRGRWPGSIPAVAQLLAEGIELGPATVLVGENGSGKSTLVEAIAMAFGLGGEGGSTGPRRHTRESESPLSEHLALLRGVGASRRGYFLRAETMHGLYTFLEENPRLPSQQPDVEFHALSHGESFLALLEDRFRDSGLWVLDEPESALSVTGCLALLQHLVDLLADGRSQVVLSTHSPLLAALPGATILELGEWGYRRSSWSDLELTQTWRAFLDDPRRFLRHLSSGR
jgi:predicted ATPase